MAKQLHNSWQVKSKAHFSNVKVQVNINSNAVSMDMSTSPWHTLQKIASAAQSLVAQCFANSFYP